LGFFQDQFIISIFETYSLSLHLRLSSEFQQRPSTSFHEKGSRRDDTLGPNSTSTNLRLPPQYNCIPAVLAVELQLLKEQFFRRRGHHKSPAIHKTTAHNVPRSGYDISTTVQTFLQLRTILGHLILPFEVGF